jgi:PKD repeat protein
MIGIGTYRGLVTRRGRRAVAALGALILALGTIVTVSGVAHSEPTWVLMNDLGVITDSFGSSETVLVTGSAVGGQGLIPAVDLYVTSNEDWTTHDGAQLVDISNPTGTPNTAIGLEVIDLPIWLPYLKIGGYDVVVDKNQNGSFDAAFDQVIGEDASPGFRVHFDGNRRVIDKAALKAQYAAPWARAAAKARALESMVNAFEVVDEVRTYLQMFEGALVLWAPPVSLAHLPCVNSACSRVERGLVWAAAHLEPLANVLNPTVGEKCTDLLRRTVSNQSLSCSIPGDPAASLTDSSFGSTQVSTAARNIERVAKGIEADPPDPNYTQIWDYQPPITTFDTAYPGDLGKSDAALANRLNEMASRSLALLHGIERFDGAAADGDDYWAAQQAGAISDQAYALVKDLLEVKSEGPAAATAMRDAGVPGSIAGLRDHLAALQERLSSSGFTADETTAFHDAGWTDSELSDLKDQFTAVSAADLPDDAATVLEQLPSLADQAVSALWDLATYAHDIQATGPASQPPTATFTAQPTSMSAPLDISFDASGSSDPDGGIVSYDWAFGDGATGTGVTPTHRYTAPGSYTVTLTVTDDSNTKATATRTVEVHQLPPVASFTVTPTSGDAPLSVQVDGTASSDPDGSIASYAWDFGDDATANGATASHTYTSVGSYTITLTITDDHGATAKASQTVTVSSAPTNAAPVASFTVTQPTGPAPVSVRVDGTASSDPDGSIASYAWDFGDDATATGATASHTYTSAGSYTITLTVTDDDGATGSATRSVSVAEPNRDPSPQNDRLQAAPTGAVDVLANDRDPDTDALTVTDTGTPAHGTATCSPMGACNYVADKSYTGTDAFRYTVQDIAGHTATATVEVTVDDAPSVTSSGPTANDDTTATKQGTAVDIHVLANDDGSAPLSLATNSNPPHGDVSCTADGTCHYQPAAGFSGVDGFTYTIRDNAGGTATAFVRIAVAPGDAGYGIDAAGHPSDPAHASDPALAQGGDASWQVAVKPTPAGLAQEATQALPAPSATTTVTGPHALTASSIRTAEGWSAQPTGSDPQHPTGLRLQPDKHALLGESISEPFPRPLPPISQGTGGDGHVPIIVVSKVFAFFHHAQPTSVTCVDRATGRLCPGYPKPLTLGTTNIPGPGAVVGTRIYVHLLPERSYAQTAPVALFCWDAATDSSCGLTIVDRVLSTSNPRASAPVLIQGHIYFGGDTGRLYCVDPTTNAPCTDRPFIPTGVSPAGSFDEFDIVGHGSRVFISDPDQVACVDVAANATCAGWDKPKPLGWNLINQHDASGATVGVCGVMGGTATCVKDNDPAHTTTFSGWPTTDDYYSVTEEAETGTRTLVGSLSHAGVGCWDWATMAPCAGGSYDSSGWLTTDTSGNGLPSAYGAAWDGTCVVALGDPGQVFTADPAGHSPCTSLNTGTAAQTVDLRTQRCDGTVGKATWTKVTLVDTNPTGGAELNSVKVTVRDAQTGATLAAQELIGTNGVLDLSHIDPSAHPAVSVSATATSVAGDPAWADGIPPRIQLSWHSDPQQGCFTTTTKVDCTQPLTSTIGIEATLDGTAVDDKATLSLTRSPTCPTVDNQPPVLDKVAGQTVQYSDPLTFRVTASDPDGDPLTLQASGLPQGVSFTDNHDGTGSVQGTVTAPPGSYVATIVAEDGHTAAVSQKVTVTVAPEDCTLTSPVDIESKASGPTPLTTKMGEQDTSLGDRSNKTISFTATDATGTAYGPFTATTNSAGEASTTAALREGVYAVNAAFAGGTYYKACKTLSDTIVTVSPATAKVTGGGWLANGTGRTSFGFNAISDVSGLHGQIQVRTANGGKFHGAVVLILSANDNKAQWTGTGTWNGHTGYRFTATVVDNGARAKKADTISLSVSTPAGNSVWSSNGVQSLKGGDIVVHP